MEGDGSRVCPIVVRDPDDGSVLGELQPSSDRDLEAALDAGASAARRIHLPTYERVRILETCAARVSSEHEVFAQLIATEGVKTIREARVEAARCVETLKLSAEEAKRIGGEVLAMDQAMGGAGRLGWYQHRPVGLVAAFTSFNDPVNLVAHKLGPAMAAGAPIILKPHPQTPFSALKLRVAMIEAGAPQEMVQVVLGGAELGGNLVRDSRPRVVSFTGGRAAGRSIVRESGFKRLILELGGVGVVVVAADADLVHAAQAISSGAFWAAGQNCVHAQRIVVERPVADELRQRLVDLAEGLRQGPKRDPRTDLGPCVNPTAASSVLTRVERARSAGGRVLVGGTGDGSRVAATWIDNLPTNHELLTDEVFGPVATLETCDDPAGLFDALERADHALNVAVFTNSIETAFTAYEKANAGAVIVNDSTDFRIDAMPFGGGGGAGLGREGVRFAIEEMMEKKMMVFRRPPFRQIEA